MAQINQPSNLVDQVVALRREVDELRKRVGIGNATISGGTFTVQDNGVIRMVDADGHVILYFGPGGDGKQIIRIRRDGGSDVMYTYTTDSGRQFWALTDGNSGIVASDDALSGSGLARPWIPVSLEQVRFANMPTVTNGSFETVWEANFQKTHPFVQLFTVEGCDSATNGEGQIVITDSHGAARVADSWSLGPGLGRHYRGPYALPGQPYDGEVRVAVNWRRTSGTGNVYAVAMDAVQRQT
jgi:hypothetical protein